MKGFFGRLLVALAVIGASACARQPPAVTDCASFVVSPSEYYMELAGRAGEVTQQEHTFICRATIFARAQVIFARMAQQQAASPTVQEFARATADDKAQMNHHLAQIAVQQDGIAPPRGLDAPRLAIRGQLVGLSGDAFDRAYLQHAIAEEQAAITLFGQETSAGEEPTLRRFALNALPRLEEHLQLAQSIAARQPVAASPGAMRADEPR